MGGARRLRAARLMVLGVLLSPGCGSGPVSQPSAAGRAVIRVAAASDLQDALPEVVTRFQRGHQVDVVPVFGSSGNLASQIRQGAPFDVFLSASEAYIDDLAGEGVIDPDSARPYTRGVLVLAVHPASATTVRTLDDLAKPEIKRVAIANPEYAPYGMAARQALASANLWDQLQPKLAQADSVRHALQFVESGNAEAGLVAHSVAWRAKVRSTEVDQALYRPIVQGLGVVTRSRHRGEAEAFTAFLLGEGGQSILRSFGFRPAQGDR